MEAVVRYGKDTWAGSGAPNVNHNDANRLRLKSGESYGYVHLKTPVPPGLTVVSATLTLYVAKSPEWSGTKTVKLRRLAERVPFGKLTWNNKPGVTGSSQPTVTVSNPTTGQALAFDVTTHLQTVANGDPHYGWRIETDSTSAHRVFGFDSDYPPILVVEYAISPSQPVDLSPAGGAVSLAKPVVSFDAADLENPTDMSALQVQFDAAGDFTAPDWDSGWVTSSVPELDLAATTYPGLANGATTYWRARYKNGEGVEGDWSDPVSFSRAAKGTVTITNPAASPNNFVSEATPPILWTFSGTQVAWRVLIVEAADHTRIVADSKKQDGTDNSWTSPAKKLQDDGAYQVIVRVWDGVARVATPLDPLYAAASRDFAFNEDPTVNAPTMVSAEQVGGTPFVKVTVTRSTAPDSWTLLMGGEVVDAGVDPADSLTTGTTHELYYLGAAPMKSSDFQVRAVVNGKASPKSAIASVTPAPKGVWLLDFDRERYVHIAGTDVDSWRRTDQVGVYTTVGGKRVQITAGSNGIADAFEGVLYKVEGRTKAQWRNDFDWMAARPNRTYQLVAADLSIPVKIRNASATPHPDTTAANPRDRVYFDFFEVDA